MNYIGMLNYNSGLKKVLDERRRL